MQTLSMHNINTITMFPYFKYILLIVYLVKKNNILLFIALYITYYKFSILSLPLILSHKKNIIEICYNFIWENWSLSIKSIHIIAISDIFEF